MLLPVPTLVSTLAAVASAVLPAAHVVGAPSPGFFATDAVVTVPSGILAVGSAPVPGKTDLGTVTLIDTATNSIVRTFKIAGFPNALAVAPSGTTVYVAATGSDERGLPGTFRSINVVTGAGKSINIGTAPTAIALAPKTGKVYVACSFDAATQQPAGSVWPINTASGVAVHPLKVAAGPTAIDVTANGQAGLVAGTGAVTLLHPAAGVVGPYIDVQAGAIALSPNGRTAYLVGHAKNEPIEVVPVNMATGAKGKAITTGASVAAALAISPGGKTLFIVGDPDPGLGATQDTITVVSTPTGHVGKTLNLGVHPNNNYWTIALNPNGQTSYVLGYGSAGVPGVAIPFNTATLAVGKAVRVGDNAGEIAFAPSGKWAYVLDDGVQAGAASSPGKVVPIDVATGLVGRPVPVAGYAEAMAAS